MHSFFLNHPSPLVLIPALRTVGNIVTGDDMQTQVVIAADIIGPLVHLLQTAEFDIKKEVPGGDVDLERRENEKIYLQFLPFLQISPSRVHHFGQGCSISVAILVTSKKSPFSIDLGGEGDCFYVVGSGEFEVLATQEEKNEEVPRVLQLYTAEKLSSFGELALMLKDITLNYPKESAERTDASNLAKEWRTCMYSTVKAVTLGLFFLEARIKKKKNLCYVLKRSKLVKQPPWDLEVGKNFIIHYTYGCDYSLKGKLTYGKFGEWRFDKRSYLRGPPPRNLSLPPPGVPESVRVPQRNFVRPMSPSIAPFVSSQPVRPFVNPSGFPQKYMDGQGWVSISTIANFNRVS
ncbi:hypothetical protein IFM89_021760 [Coptis chinensis]|uniref:Cyclic nucleotide-binding domain-containing protein n=1 Tax=Coptis chinensis TaxID=261450 RepID=A0A835H4Y9_9MAGN|nr:hypothetical protein IFM89_021760 [Coptis chinensis]